MEENVPGNFQNFYEPARVETTSRGRGKPTLTLTRPHLNNVLDDTGIFFLLTALRRQREQRIHWRQYCPVERRRVQHTCETYHLVRAYRVSKIYELQLF